MMLIRSIFLLVVAQVVFCGSTLAGNPRVFPKEVTFTVKVAQPRVPDYEEIEYNSTGIGHKESDICGKRYDEFQAKVTDSRKTKDVKFTIAKSEVNEDEIYQDPYVYETDDDEEANHDNLKLKSFSSRENEFTIYSNSHEVSFLNDNGLQLTMTKRHDNPFMGSDFPIMFGKIEAEFKSAPGKGIISSIYLQGDDLDEIDIIETFGSFPQTYQTNYFVKGDVSEHNLGVYHISHIPLHSQYQKISVEWNEVKICWYFNNQLVREIHKGNPDGFPSSPMYLKISLWAGGDPENESGTIEWAGGITDYNQLPVSMFVKNLYIHDYSTGTEYYYGDRGRLFKRQEQTEFNHTKFRTENIYSNTLMFPQLPLLANYTQETSGGVQLPSSCSLIFLVFAYELVLVWCLL